MFRQERIAAPDIKINVSDNYRIEECSYIILLGHFFTVVIKKFYNEWISDITVVIISSTRQVLDVVKLAKLFYKSLKLGFGRTVLGITQVDLEV